jgi:hypothetical protein
MTDAETIAAEWGSVWTKSGCKDHLMPTCPRCNDDYTRRSVDVYPPSHMDVCSWCQRRFEAWREGLSADETGRCDRCGSETSEVEYCRDCREVIDRRAARRKAL